MANRAGHLALSFLAIGLQLGLMAMSAYLISKSALVQDITEIALAVTAVRVFAHWAGDFPLL